MGVALPEVILWLFQSLHQKIVATITVQTVELHGILSMDFGSEGDFHGVATTFPLRMLRWLTEVEDGEFVIHASYTSRYPTTLFFGWCDRKEDGSVRRPDECIRTQSVFGESTALRFVHTDRWLLRRAWDLISLRWGWLRGRSGCGSRGRARKHRPSRRRGRLRQSGRPCWGQDGHRDARPQKEKLAFPCKHAEHGMLLTMAFVKHLGIDKGKEFIKGDNAVPIFIGCVPPFTHPVAQ